MRTLTATSFRKSLFKVLSTPAQSIPTRVRYKKGDAILLSYEQYRRLHKHQPKKGGKLAPLVRGKIIKSLDDQANSELMHYMGFS